MSGTVYDFIADMVADRRADIGQVTLSSATRGTIALVSVSALDAAEQGTIAPHPLAAELARHPGLSRSIRPYPFAGRFESEVITLPISSGHNGIYAHATNWNGGSGASGIDIDAEIDRDAQRYEIEAELDNQLDIGLLNPVLVYIEDPSVTNADVGQLRASINGADVGLRFIDGQLQLDRPIMGVNRGPSGAIPNLVNVTGDPDHFVIRRARASAAAGARGTMDRRGAAGVC